MKTYQPILQFFQSIQLALKLVRADPATYGSPTTQGLAWIVWYQARFYRILLTALILIGCSLWGCLTQLIYQEIQPFVPEALLELQTKLIQIPSLRFCFEMNRDLGVIKPYREAQTLVVTKEKIALRRLSGIDQKEENNGADWLAYCDRTAQSKLCAEQPYLLVGHTLAKDLGILTGQCVHLIPFIASSAFQITGLNGESPAHAVECHVLPQSGKVFFDEFFLAIPAQHFDKVFHTQPSTISTWTYNRGYDGPSCGWKELVDLALQNSCQIKNWKDWFPEIAKDLAVFRRATQVCLFALALFSLMGLCVQIKIASQALLPMIRLLRLLGAQVIFCKLVCFLGFMREMIICLAAGTGLGWIGMHCINRFFHPTLTICIDGSMAYPIANTHVFQVGLSTHFLFFFLGAHFVFALGLSLVLAHTLARDGFQADCAA